MHFAGKVALFTALAPLVAGCATYNMTKPAPAQSQAIAISVNSAGPNGWTDLPVGAYRVPNTNTIISGHQKSNIGGAFGLIGVLAQDAIQSGEAADKVKNAENALHIDLTPQVAAAAQKLVASGKYGQTFTSTTSAGGPTLTVSPYLMVTFTSDTEVRPYVILKADLKGQGNAPAWTNRYIASLGKPVPLDGENGLTANGGKSLSDSLAHDVDVAVATMLDDVANHPARDEGKLVYVESAFPYMRQRVALTGYPLHEDDQSLVLSEKIPDGVIFAGVSVLDKSVTTTRSAKADDKFKVLDESN